MCINLLLTLLRKGFPRALVQNFPLPQGNHSTDWGRGVTYLVLNFPAVLKSAHWVSETIISLGYILSVADKPVSLTS